MTQSEYKNKLKKINKSKYGTTHFITAAQEEADPDRWNHFFIGKKIRQCGQPTGICIRQKMPLSL